MANKCDRFTNMLSTQMVTHKQTNKQTDTRPALLHAAGKIIHTTQHLSKQHPLDIIKQANSVIHCKSVIIS